MKVQDHHYEDEQRGPSHADWIVLALVVFMAVLAALGGSKGKPHAVAPVALIQLA